MLLFRDGPLLVVASGRDTISITSSIKRLASDNVFVVQVWNLMLPQWNMFFLLQIVIVESPFHLFFSFFIFTHVLLLKKKNYFLVVRLVAGQYLKWHFSFNDEITGEFLVSLEIFGNISAIILSPCYRGKKHFWEEGMCFNNWQLESYELLGSTGDWEHISFVQIGLVKASFFFFKMK